MHISAMPKNARAPGTDRSRYLPPQEIVHVPLSELLLRGLRENLESKQLDMLRRGETSSGKDIVVHCAGDLDILSAPCVSIVGTREVSDRGRNRADWLARKLAGASVAVVSGLAKGVDAAAHRGAIEAKGKTIAVIGTPLSKAYPIENAKLQEQIYTQHLLISPFAEGDGVFKSNFPARNRVMAAVSDATVIIEASDTSGTLHQAAECTRLKRWLFISSAILEDPAVTWPERFLKTYDRAVVLTHISDILDRIQR